MARFSNTLEAARVRVAMRRVREVLDQLPLCSNGCGRHVPVAHKGGWCDKCAHGAAKLVMRLTPDGPWLRPPKRRGGIGHS